MGLPRALGGPCHTMAMDLEVEEVPICSGSMSYSLHYNPSAVRANSPRCRAGAFHAAPCERCAAERVSLFPMVRGAQTCDRHPTSSSLHSLTSRVPDLSDSPSIVVRARIETTHCPLRPRIETTHESVIYSFSASIRENFLPLLRGHEVCSHSAKVSIMLLADGRARVVESFSQVW